jgi:predicted DNA-binding transcriptional regulator
MDKYKIEKSFNEFNGMIEFELYEKATIGYMYIDTFPSKSEAEFFVKNLIEKDIANES